MILDA
jgi:DNA mismatch repair protein MSH6